MLNRKTGVLLANIGSPASLKLQEVKIYLARFLSDPRVVDLPYLLRKILVNYIIVPFRAKRTLAAYNKIWTRDGPPLVANSMQLQHKLAAELGDNFHVAIGMSYSKPCLYETMYAMCHSNCDAIILVPLFPQYAQATTGSVVEICRQALAVAAVRKNLTVIEYFYNDQHYLQALYKIISANLAKIGHYDFILFSYHGLPVKQLQKVTDPHKCYKEHCYNTTAHLANLLGITKSIYTTAFQSRLGYLQWLQPYMDDMLVHLARQGVKDLVVVCPSFVLDCLETLEEIGIRAREHWFKLGGHNFYLIPCLNSEPDWVTGLANIIKAKAAGEYNQS